ncbi:MAG: Cobyrinic acid ac-diamide synthase [Holophagaceae bacterium]|nr:Cobyrinic acid ac-diamide synthase [Holophagaceae bacterium]
MIVAVASGKGGTGKTTVSASLAATWERPLVAVDLDVEEPNLHLFLKPSLVSIETVNLEVPVLDAERCNLCRACTELCQFKALAIFGKTLMVMPEMCHGCGGCFEVCPTGALKPGSRELGVMEIGHSRGSIPCLTGRLRIGESMSPPLMRQIRHRMAEMATDMGADVIIDAPPGVSCPAMNAVQDSDVILLVTEPTPFGFHDFQLAWEAFTPLKKPMGVVINRAGLGDDRAYAFCKAKGLPILAEIPYRREIAEHYAKGGLLAELDNKMRWTFARLQEGLDRLHKEVIHA